MQKYNKLDENVLALLQNAMDAGDKQVSVRSIARDVLGKESRESSIRSAIKRGLLVRKTVPRPQTPKMLTIDIANPNNTLTSKFDHHIT